MVRSACLLTTLLVACAVGCVPADEALPLGSAQFTITGGGSPRLLSEDVVADGWNIRIDRFIVSFKTMTIVNLTNSDQCAYRGRGATSNVVFEAMEGSVVQAFNGIKPGACPDVGMRLGAPDDRTVLGEGANADDLIALATDRPALAFVEATATRQLFAGGTTVDEMMHVALRFDALTTPTAFGGCRDAIKGAKIVPEARHAQIVSFALATLFRDAFSETASLRFSPFARADRMGDDDGTVTMDELDALRLSSVVANDFYERPDAYERPDGTSRGSFGDWVRMQFQFSVKFGRNGECTGLPPDL